MVGRHHQINGHEFKQTPGNSEGQGSLVSGTVHGVAESDTTWQLNDKKYTPPCVQQTASKKLLSRTESSAWCSVMTWGAGRRGCWKGGPGRRGSMYTQLIYFTVQQKLTQHCKATIPQFKNI